MLNFTPQQQIRQQQQQYVTTMRQSPAMNSPQTPLSANGGSGNYFDGKCSSNLETNYHQQQVFLPPAQQNLENRQQSISRLSKQHPQLAAKLLQPSPNFSVVNNTGTLQQQTLPTDISNTGNGNSIGSLEKIGDQSSSQELNQPPVNLLPPQNKRVRRNRDYTGSVASTPVLSSSTHLNIQNNQQQHVTIINSNSSSRSYTPEASNQHQSYIVAVPPQSSHSIADSSQSNQHLKGFLKLRLLSIF